MLYEARRLFRNLGDELVLNDKEHEEINGWKRRLDNLIEEYEDWKAEEEVWREREHEAPLSRGGKFRHVKGSIRLPGPGPNVDELD